MRKTAFGAEDSDKDKGGKMEGMKKVYQTQELL